MQIKKEEAYIMGIFTEKQYKSTCKSCGKEWYYTKQDLRNSKDNSTLNQAKKYLGVGSFMLGGGLLSAAIAASPDLPTISAYQCPACGSRSVIRTFDRRILK